MDEFRQRSALRAHGVSPRSSLLLVGPPGCGEPTSAEAVTGQLGLPIAKVQLATVVSSYLGDATNTANQESQDSQYDRLAKVTKAVRLSLQPRAARDGHRSPSMMASDTRCSRGCGEAHRSKATAAAGAKEEVLAFAAFPAARWQKIWVANPLERISKEIKRRSRVVGILPNEA